MPWGKTVLKWEKREKTNFSKGTLVFLYLHGDINNDTCRLCGEEKETVEHLLCHCIAREATRRRIFMNCTPEPAYFNNINLLKLLNYIKKLDL